MISGATPSFEINRAKKIRNINWDRIVHPIMCNISGIVDRNILSLSLKNDLVPLHTHVIFFSRIAKTIFL